jgi:hypothetical protein
MRYPPGYECRNMVGIYSCNACGTNEMVGWDGRCQCQQGLVPGADGQCRCIPGTSQCDNCGGPNTRLDGNLCICKDGYEGDPTVGCVDIDECERGTHREVREISGGIEKVPGTLLRG